MAIKTIGELDIAPYAKRLRYPARNFPYSQVIRDPFSRIGFVRFAMTDGIAKTGKTYPALRPMTLPTDCDSFSASADIPS